MQAEKQFVFIVRIEDIQKESERNIGRKLNESELQTAAKGVEAGLSTDVGQILKTAIEEAVV